MVDPILLPVSYNTGQSSLKLISIGLSLLVSSLALSQTHAHGGWGSCNNNSGRGWYSLDPHQHHHRNGRGYGCGIRRSRSYYYNRRPMDIVGDLFLDINSLFQQQTTQSHQTTKDSDSSKTSRPSEAEVVKEEDNSSMVPPPRFEIFEDGPNGMVELTMEVPGLAAEDLSVEVENGSLLRIRGSRTRQPLEEVEEGVVGSSRRRRSHHQVVRQRAAFEEIFVLDDDMNVDQLRVTLWRGILTVQIPKKAKVVRRIPIRLEKDGERDDDTPKILNAIQKKDKIFSKRKNVNSSKRSWKINSGDDDEEEDEDPESGLQFLDDDKDDDDTSSAQ